MLARQSSGVAVRLLLIVAQVPPTVSHRLCLSVAVTAVGPEGDWLQDACLVHGIMMADSVNGLSCLNVCSEEWAAWEVTVGLPRIWLGAKLVLQAT